MIPLRGQGKPLPADCPYTGEWLLGNKMFLYRPEHGGTEIELAAIFQMPDGEWCFGFNAETMAAQLGIASEEIFVHNRNRTLILAGTADVPPAVGGTAAKAYRFTIDGNRFADFVIENSPSGTA
jgi:hypothetical protein